MRRLLLGALPRWPARLRKPGLPELVCAALALSCLILPEWWAVSRNRAERRQELRLSLQARIEEKRQILRHWAATLRAEVGWWAGSPPVRSAIEQQLRLAPDREVLLTSPALAELRRLFWDYFSKTRPHPQRSAQFLVVSPGGLGVAGGDQSVIGLPSESRLATVFQEALHGETGLAPLGSSALFGSPPSGTEQSSWNLVVAAPVRDSNGAVVAVLCVRLDVADELQGRMAEGSEKGLARIFAYSSSGAWLSERPLQGPIATDTAPAPAQPTVPPVSEVLAQLSPEGERFGSLADEVVVNLEGYRGCLGEQVVGAGGAVPELGLGLFAELDFDQAYRSVSRVRWNLIALGLFLGFSLLLVALSQTSDGGVGWVAPRRASRNSAAWAILAVSLLATVLTWLTAKSKVDGYDRSRFEREAELIRDDLLERIERYGDALTALRASHQTFRGSGPGTFKDLARSLRGAPGMGGISYLAFVQPSEATQQVAFGRASGGRPSQHGLTVKYQERLGDSPSADLGGATLDSLAAVANQACEPGRTVISGVVPEGPSAEDRIDPGFLVLTPAFAPGAVPEAAICRASLLGWVVAFVKAREMMRTLASRAAPGVDFEVYDGEEQDGSPLIYDRDGAPSAERQARFRQTTRIEVGGRPWTLSFASTPDFDTTVTRDHPAQVLIGGLAISVLLFDIALVLSSTRSKALAIAEVMTRRLREGEARVRAVIDHAPDGFITFDRRGLIDRFNPGAEKLFGYSAKEVLGSPIETLIPAALPATAAAETDPDTAPHREPGHSRECTARRQDGSSFPAELTVSRMELDDGPRFTAIVRDISERKAAEKALRDSEERYALAARGANDGLWDWDLRTGQIYFSPRWRAMLGLEEKEASGRPEDWLDRVHQDDRQRLQIRLSEHLEGHTSHFEGEYRTLHTDGSYRWMLSRGIAVRDAAGQAIRMAGSQTDVTERKQAERRLLYDALHDPLTGLPNRTYFMGQLERATKETQRQPANLFAILFLDLDRFKVVNDGLGHFVGDQLLIAITDRLKMCLRPGDTIARLGGDEFAILAENLCAVSDATRIAERIQKELAQPFRIGGREVFTAVSIGITLSTSGRHAPEDLLRDADTAMYRAKAQGRACYELFDQGMHTRAVEFLFLETALRRAVERRELRVHYQPIVSLSSGHITRCEALVRWQHPERGLLMPGEFIPVAEETGLIIPMSVWLLRTACAQIQAWRKAGLPPVRLAVNISPRQLKQQDLFDIVMRTLSEAGLDPGTLELEMTESALMEGNDSTIKPLVELYDKGVQIALDDFGTGYSSLIYLRRFPISTLKIDSAFVKGIITDPGDAAIASGLIALAHSLNLKVTAEGVETRQQMGFLQAKNCDEVQGHLISAPLDHEAFGELLRRGVTVPARPQLERTGIGRTGT